MVHQAWPKGALWAAGHPGIGLGALQGSAAPLLAMAGEESALVDHSSRSPQVSDLWARLLLSPVIGVIVPNVSGLIDHSRHTGAALVASYAYFTLVSLAS